MLLPAQVLKKSGLLLGLAGALLLPTTLVASPTVEGVFRGELGQLDLQTVDGRVSGRYLQGGGCEYQPGRRVLEGQFEGNVLIGSVLLCQRGEACPEQVYAFLGFYNPAEGVFSADIKLEAGCSSPALRGTRLSLREIPVGERGATRRASAATKTQDRRNYEAAVKATEAAQRHLENSEFAQARTQYEVALSYQDSYADFWVGYLNLGVAEMGLGNTARAIEAYERARDLQLRSPSEKNNLGDTYFNLACAHAKRTDKQAALSNLALAVKNGFAMPEEMNADPDLSRLLAADAEFERLVQQTKNNKDRAHSRR